MKILQSPADAAEGLRGYPAERSWVEIPSGEGQIIRINVIDVGLPFAPPVVLLHGNPSWSYLWRHQIGPLVEAGHRVIVPDLVGMGMSDKPSELDDYSVERHVEWMRCLLVDELALSGCAFVLHDWGGIIGMRLAAEQPGLVDRMVISNTGLPWRDITEPLPDDLDASGPYADFQEMARTVPLWEPWTLLTLVLHKDPTEEQVAGYHAPYPDPALTIGSRAFTQLLPTRPDNPMYPANYEAWKTLDDWHRPVLTIFSDHDTVAPNGWEMIVDRVPGAAGQPHVILEGGGHFLQEDIPDAYNEALLSWLEATS